jgi:predicted peptidase
MSPHRCSVSLLTLLLMISMVSVASAQSERISPVAFSREVTSTIDVQYLVYLPDAYDETPDAWPLVLFLHGAGERGDDVSRVGIHGPLKHVREGQSFPFIIVAPLVPEIERWTVGRLDAVMAEIRDRYRIDESRIYLTGLSMGGYGTWDYAMARPGVFAAIAPICGGGQAHHACVLRDTPIWAFHGAKDTVVPVDRSREMVAALEQCGGDVHYTEYPDAGHDAWSETYANDAFYEWLLSHQLPD